MNLSKMISFSPDDEDMLMLPLQAVVWNKFTLIGNSKEDNYNFIRYMFSNEEIKDYFYNWNNTVFYDFDVTNSKYSKFVTCFEMSGTCRYDEFSLYVEEIVKAYKGELEISVDMFTHNSKHYQLTKLDEIVSLFEVIKEDQ